MGCFAVLSLVLAQALAEPTLPVLVATAPAAYPPQALAEGREATVLLQLQIDAEGVVRAAEVVEPAGGGFDQAAIDAALGFTFAPALGEDGAPTASAILYRYVFEVQAAPTRSAEGRLRQAGTRAPLPGVVLRLSGPGGARRAVTTDEAGRFALVELEPGPWAVVFEAPGYTAEIVSFEVEPGKVAQITIHGTESRPWEGGAYEEIEVFGVRTEPELTERILSAEEIRYLPGTNGDVVRAVQNLPGVARPPLNIGQLLIRGTAPEDSGYAIDGVGVPVVFHFSGLSTVLAGDLLSEVSFLPGSYGVRYGRTLGGVVDLRATRELPARSGGYASVDVYQATAFVQQRLSDDTALTLAGRRSYVDAVLNPILNDGAAAVQAPRYYDAQLRLQHQTRRGTVDALVFASDDRFRVVGGEAADPDEVQIGLATSFLKARARWIEELGAGWRSEAALLFGPDANTFELAPEGEAYEENLDLALRQEVYRLPGSAGIGLRLGFDGLLRHERFRYDVPSFGYAPEAGEAVWLSPSPYAEATLRRGALTLTPGLRLDPLLTNVGYRTFALDPRLAASVELSPSTTLEASAGRYSQFPELRQVLAEQGAAGSLGPASNLQLSAGGEQRLGPGLSLEATGYVSRLQDLVVGREDRFEFFTGPPPVGPFDTDPYANDGTGTVVGLETQLRLQSRRFVGWLAATFSRSVRTDRPGDEPALFAYDQPVVLNALGSYQLPSRWRVGARVRYGSGNPYTPVVNRFQLLDEGRFVPVYGEADGARLPAFYQVDLRMDKDWAFKQWTLTTYLDLQNATGARNVEVMGWTYDYAEEDPVTGLPPLPALGIRGEW